MGVSTDVIDDEIEMSNTNNESDKASSKSTSKSDESESESGSVDDVRTMPLAQKMSSVAHVKTITSELILKEKTPWMQDLELQVERVLAILEKAIIKLKIMIMIPKLLENDMELLLKYVTRDQAEFIFSICNKYLTDEHKSASMVDKLYIPYLKEKKDKLDPQMTNVLNILYKSDQLVNDSREYRDPNLDQSSNLILYLQKLKEAIKIKLNISAEEEQQREQELHRSFHANEVCRAEIEKLQEQVEQQRETLGNMLKVKEDLIQQYEEKLNTIQENFKHTIIKKVNESEKQMVQESLASEARRTDLEVEAKTSVHNYEQMLEHNLAEEKALRAKRSKVETQLASWLAKFDADIGERNAEFEQVQAEYDEEKAAFDALQEKMDEQDVQYRVLMREKEEEEKKQFEIKALIFLQNRSARRIQRAWRAYKERKELRKKKRKAAAAKKAKKVQEKLAEAVASMKKRSKKDLTEETKEKKEKKGKKEEVAPEPAEVPDEDEDLKGAIPKTKEEETEGEGQGQEPKKTKKVKEKGKKGKPKKGANTLPKGEIPKSKKDVKITKDANAASALDTAFGGQFDELDTTTAFTKEEVKVDL